jgi:subtilisin family serine protease
LVPGVRQQEGWLYPGDSNDKDYDPEGDYDPTEGDYDLEQGHGTCMTGLISSPTYGVAKRAELVIVKTPQGTFSDQTSAFTMVHNDILKQRAKGVTMRPVINYSRNMFIPGPNDTPFADDDVQKLYDALKQLIDDGAVVLACAGNRGVGDF